MLSHMKICIKCNESLTDEDFYIANRKTGQLRTDCKKCNMGSSKEWARNNRSRRRMNLLKYVYKITKEDYLALIDKQQNSCAICGRHRDSLNRNLAVDHCHTTGKIRGLLCTTCNQGLGNFKDKKDLLINAIGYLEENND